MKTTKQIAAAIATIANKGNTWKTLVQECATDVALHVLQHGDVRLAADLCDAVSLNGGHYENLCKWLAEYAFIRFEKGAFTLNKAGRKAALDPFGGFCDMAEKAWLEEIKAGGMWYAEVEAERKERMARAFDSFKEADKLVQKMLQKGDAQLASKMAALIAEYKETMKL